MARSRIYMKIFYILTLLIPAIGLTPVNAQDKVEAGDKAYDFIGYDEAGSKIRLSDFEGDKYVLLNFTATACAPCWKTYLPMNEMQEKYVDQLKVISIHWDDAKKQWDNIAENIGLEFKCTSLWEVNDKNLLSDVYQIDGWPYFFLIDKDGYVVEKWFGHKKRKLKRTLKKHL